MAIKEKNEEVLVVKRHILEEIGLFQGVSFNVDRYLAELWKGNGVSFMARQEAEKNPAYKQLIKEYQSDPKAWKERHQYGKRSLVETVFSMMKVRYGGSLSSRRYKEQRRELLIKVILHNIGRLNFLECDGR